MGMLMLLAGLLLWVFAHLFKRLNPTKREALGDRGRGLAALGIGAGLVLMILGYRSAPFIPVWWPPVGMIHATNLLVLLAFWFFALSMVPGKLSAKVRHKQLTGVKLWATGHLLANGDLAAMLLFGGLLAWAVVTVIMIKRQAPEWERPAAPSLKYDLLAFVIALGLFGAAAWAHTQLGVYPFPRGG